jgi:hypothetical protein
LMVDSMFAYTLSNFLYNNLTTPSFIAILPGLPGLAGPENLVCLYLFYIFTSHQQCILPLMSLPATSIHDFYFDIKIL